MENGGPAGPERLTPFESLLTAMRLPYPVACLLLAIVAGAPGFILVAYAHTSDWDLALRLVFSQPKGATREGAVASTIFVFVNFLVFYGIARLRQRIVSAKEQLISLAPDGEGTYRRAFRYVSSWWPVVIAFALEGISAISSVMAIPGGQWLAEGPYLLVLEALRFLMSVGVLTLVWVYATGLKGLHELGAQPLRLKSYHEDPLLGTRPIGQISLRFGLWFAAVLILVLLANSLVPDDWTFGVVAVFALIGITMFFLPLSSIHRRMTEVKGKETRSVRARFARLMGDAEDPAQPLAIEPFAQLDRRLRELAGLQVLDMEIRETGSIRTWPFDTRILGQLTVIILSVVAALIVRLVIVALPVLR